MMVMLFSKCGSRMGTHGSSRKLYSVWLSVPKPVKLKTKTGG